MTIAIGAPAAESSATDSPRLNAWWLWSGLLLVLLILYASRDSLPWAFDPPGAVTWLKDGIRDAWRWLIGTPILGLFTLKEATRSVSWALTYPMQALQVILAPSFKRPVWLDPNLPSIPWITITGLAAIFAHYYGGWRLALLPLLAGCYFAFFGMWNPTMESLASIAIAVPLSAIIGLLLGIWAYRSPTASAFLRAYCDLMQTIPIWSFFIPVIVLVGINPVGALVATMVYSIPPMIRVAELALKAVPPELIDFGRMTGSTPRQLMWLVRVPAARDSLLLGLNQVIMLSLNLVILTSTMGARGLGFHVWNALNRSKLGAGLEFGMAIVVLAVVLDRLSKAVAQRRPGARRPTGTLTGDHPYLVFAIGFALISMLVAWLIPLAYIWPETGPLRLTTAPIWDGLVTWINVNLFDVTEAVRDFTLIYVLSPIRNLMLSLPWIWVVLAVVAAGYLAGGLKLGLFSAGLVLAIALVGLWQPAVVSVYEVLMAMLICYVIGFPLAVVAARSDRFWAVLQPVADLLQTMPSFIFLIPFVILFRTGEFTSILIIVSFAIAPVIRYTAEGLRAVPQHVVEAARAHGASRSQLLWQVELPLALPSLVLGLNQTLMMALSMLVITAYVGTRDLGQAAYGAMVRGGDTDIGTGVLAGLAVCAIAIASDRIIRASADKLAARLGVTAGN